MGEYLGIETGWNDWDKRLTDTSTDRMTDWEVSGGNVMSQCEDSTSILQQKNEDIFLANTTSFAALSFERLTLRNSASFKRSNFNFSSNSLLFSFNSFLSLWSVSVTAVRTDVFNSLGFCPCTEEGFNLRIKVKKGGKSDLWGWNVRVRGTVPRTEMRGRGDECYK